MSLFALSKVSLKGINKNFGYSRRTFFSGNKKDAAPQATTSSSGNSMLATPIPKNLPEFAETPQLTEIANSNKSKLDELLKSETGKLYKRRVAQFKDWKNAYPEQVPSLEELVQEPLSELKREDEESQNNEDPALTLIKDRMEDTPAVRYAYVLYSNYDQVSDLKRLFTDMVAVQEEYGKGEEFAGIIDDEFHSNVQINDKVNKFLKTSKFSEEMKAFLELLAENGRIKAYQSIFESVFEIDKLLAEPMGEVTVVTAEQTISDDMKKRFAKMVRDSFGLQATPTVTHVYSPSVLGGYELFWNNNHLDNSKRTMIEDLNRSVVEAEKSFVAKQEADDRAEFDAAVAQLVKDRQAKSMQ